MFLSVRAITVRFFINNKFINFNAAKLVENIIFTKIKLNLIFFKTYFSGSDKKKKCIIFLLFTF